MSRRSPARFLAPLALLAAVAIIYLVVHNGLKGSSTTSSSTGPTTSSTTKAAKKKAGTKKVGNRARTYVVKSGDVLGSIATKTKVSVADLLTINHLDPASPLRVGQKLKLAP